MMMICSRCKKRPAVVFVQRSDGTEFKNEGFCFSCARSLNIPQVEQMMKQMGGMGGRRRGRNPLSGMFGGMGGSRRGGFPF